MTRQQLAVDTSVAVPLLVQTHVHHAAADLTEARFGSTLTLSHDAAATLPRTLSAIGVQSGAAYDAMVALAAKEHGAVLATRDARASNTYRAVGVEVVVVG